MSPNELAACDDVSRLWDALSPLPPLFDVLYFCLGCGSGCTVLEPAVARSGPRVRVTEACSRCIREW